MQSSASRLKVEDGVHRGVVSGIAGCLSHAHYRCSVSYKVMLDAQCVRVCVFVRVQELLHRACACAYAHVRGKLVLCVRACTHV